MQESFLRAFIALDRLRDPDRFAGWLAGIVLNVCRGLQRRAPVTLLPDWPEPLHSAAADGLPSAEDLDRADALREAVADLPAGQRQAVALHYYADLPPGQIAESAGAARASLHKARLSSARRSTPTTTAVPQSPSAASSAPTILQAQPPRTTSGCSCGPTGSGTSADPLPAAPSSPTPTTPSSPSEPTATGPATRPRRGSPTTPASSCSASSWPAPAGSSYATRT